MKINWIFISLLSGIIGGGITYFLTGDELISLISAIIILVIVLLHNPATRYMRAFYTVMFPLLSNFYFTLSTKTDNFDFKAGLKEMNITTTIILGVIAVLCLVLDYLERNGKLKGPFFTIKKNVAKKVSGTNISINQKIDTTDTDD
ncbi:hypothetical protein [Dokdonia sp.]|uniref:hypothetical protein n=1 Tax=Dokdonia sp. TaxID=2024995 RepID=UPI0032651110